MPRRTEQQLDRAELSRTIRGVARIHVNNALVRILNEIEYDALEEYDKCIAEGTAFEYDFASVGERFKALRA